MDVGHTGGLRKQIKKSGFRTQKEAQDALHEMLTALRRGPYVQPSTTPFGEYLVGWADGLAAKGYRLTTVDQYTRAVHCHVLEHAVAQVPLHLLSPADLNTFYRHLQEAPCRRDGRVGPLSRRTVILIHNILRRALADAMKTKLLQANPAADASPPSQSSARPPEMTTWTAEETKLFLRSVEGDRLFPFWLLAVNTGARRGELLGLRWRDVDFDAHQIHIRQNVTQVRSQLIVGPPKTGHSSRTVDVDEGTMRVLAVYRKAVQESEAFERDDDIQPARAFDDRPVFAQRDGGYIKPSRITARFSVLVRRAGLPRISVHGLRHNHATILLTAGVNPKIVSERLGHSTAGFTIQRYGHSLPSTRNEAAARFARLVRDGDSSELEPPQEAPKDGAAEVPSPASHDAPAAQQNRDKGSTEPIDHAPPPDSPHIELPARDEPLGVHQIAELLGVRKETVHIWKHRKLLPPPDFSVGRNPAWKRATIVQWAIATERLAAHDPRAKMRR